MHRGVYRRTRSHLRKTPERAEDASSHDSKGVEKGKRSLAEQNSLSEPAVSLPTPNNTEQQQQTSEPPKTVAPSPAQPGPVKSNLWDLNARDEPPVNLKDFIGKQDRQTIQQPALKISYCFHWVVRLWFFLD